ncbi:MAG: PorT family protein [Flavobacteriaceae bacterium]|nr:PorT family protein [Flavobacteriaceae bacterium]
MKKFQLFIAVALFGMTFAVAQDVSFAATAGYVSGHQKVESAGFEASGSESGVFVGGLADIAVSDKFHVQPELVFSAISDFNSLTMPIMAKFYVADSFNLQAGPTLNYVLEESGDETTNFGILVGGGAGYDFGDKWFAQARYNFQINDYYTGDASDTSNKINMLTIGVGYKFN